MHVHFKKDSLITGVPLKEIFVNSILRCFAFFWFSSFKSTIDKSGINVASNRFKKTDAISSETNDGANELQQGMDWE